jgi:hypothetical protein
VDEALDELRETVLMEPHFHEAFFEAGRLLRGAATSKRRSSS